MATMKKDKKVKMKENVVIPIEGGGSGKCNNFNKNMFCFIEKVIKLWILYKIWSYARLALNKQGTHK